MIEENAIDVTYVETDFRGFTQVIATDVAGPSDIVAVGDEVELPHPEAGLAWYKVVRRRWSYASEEEKHSHDLDALEDVEWSVADRVELLVQFVEASK